MWLKALGPVALWAVIALAYLWLGGVQQDWWSGSAATVASNAWTAALVGVILALTILKRCQARWGVAVGASVGVIWLLSAAWSVSPGSGGSALKVAGVAAVLTVAWPSVAKVWEKKDGRGKPSSHGGPPLRQIFGQVQLVGQRTGAVLSGAGSVLRKLPWWLGLAVFALLPLLLWGVLTLFGVLEGVLISGSIDGLTGGLSGGLSLVALVTVVLAACLTVRVSIVCVPAMLTAPPQHQTPDTAARRNKNAAGGRVQGRIGPNVHPFAYAPRNASGAPVSVLESMPALGDVPGIFAWLKSCDVPSNLFVGRIMVPRADGSTSPGEWVQAKNSALNFGAAGAGKTLTSLLPNLKAAKGPAVAVSSAMDLCEETVKTRALYGKCLFWDPSGLTPAPASTTAISWSPLTAIVTPDDASRAARLLIKAMREPGSHGGGATAHFNDRAVEILSALFYAAVCKGVAADPTTGKRAGKHISDVLSWAYKDPTGDNWAEPLRLLEEAVIEIIGAGTDPATVEMLLSEQLFLDTLNREQTAMEGAHSGETQSALATARRMLLPYKESETARQAADASSSFNPADWEKTTPDGEHPTIYIRTQAGANADLFGPVIALHVSELVKSRRDAGAGAYKEPLTMVFDELAAVPIPALTSILNNDRKYGIRVLAATQSDSQLEDHPQYGKPTIEGFEVKVLFPKSGTSELHQKIENASTRTRVTMSSTGTSIAGDDFKNKIKNVLDPLRGTQGSTENTGTSQTFERTLDRAAVVGDLGPSEVRVIEGYRAITAEWEETDPISGAVVTIDAPVVVRVCFPNEEGTIWSALAEWTEASTEAAGAELEPQDLVNA